MTGSLGNLLPLAQSINSSLQNDSFDEKDIPTYCRVERQAKALCGEVMIPYEESRGMTAKMIEEKYHVSKAFAQVRRKQERR